MPSAEEIAQALFNQGECLEKIARELTIQGYRHSDGRGFLASDISRLLRNLKPPGIPETPLKDAGSTSEDATPNDSETINSDETEGSENEPPEAADSLLDT